MTKQHPRKKMQFWASQAVQERCFRKPRFRILCIITSRIVYGDVMFSVASVCHSVHRGRPHVIGSFQTCSLGNRPPGPHADLFKRVLLDPFTAITLSPSRSCSNFFTWGPPPRIYRQAGGSPSTERPSCFEMRCANEKPLFGQENWHSKTTTLTNSRKFHV